MRINLYGLETASSSWLGGTPKSPAYNIAVTLCDCWQVDCKQFIIGQAPGCISPLYNRETSVIDVKTAVLRF